LWTGLWKNKKARRVDQVGLNAKDEFKRGSPTYGRVVMTMRMKVNQHDFHICS